MHFENDGENIADVEMEEGEERPKTAAESLDEVVEAQKRQLDAWCFVEHFDPQVLLQVNIIQMHMLENWILVTCGFLLNYNKSDILFWKIGKKIPSL